MLYPDCAVLIVRSCGCAVLTVLYDCAVLTLIGCDAEHAFGNNEDQVHELGTVLWPQLAQEYITHCMKPDQARMTDGTSQLRDLLGHFSTAEQFESAAVQLL